MDQCIHWTYQFLLGQLITAEQLIRDPRSRSITLDSPGPGTPGPDAFSRVKSAAENLPSPHMRVHTYFHRRSTPSNSVKH
ncbi:hypothetical protein M378DRAFT_160414 [Amanita muscaria Koide BX008]|uniref:Uncharacterized protein n=1 Tax=Amanita muscaria (strain Koide BX008) TaxID=946122 RepID=A0A0C2WYH8_AMAMK|nr:hypothetical protein M378DRAFT_160414 [Amanita muscaria Koide BX008]